MREKMVILKFFFVKPISYGYYFFCHRQKQNYCIRHSDRAFNARQREISVKPVSIAKGCRFTYWSRFYSLKVYSKLTIALTVVSIGEERATNTCRLINTFERNQITQNNDFLNCILFWKWSKNDYSMLK